MNTAQTTALRAELDAIGHSLAAIDEALSHVKDTMNLGKLNDIQIAHTEIKEHVDNMIEQLDAIEMPPVDNVEQATGVLGVIAAGGSTADATSNMDKFLGGEVKIDLDSQVIDGKEHLILHVEAVAAVEEKPAAPAFKVGEKFIDSVSKNFFGVSFEEVAPA